MNRAFLLLILTLLDAIGAKTGLAANLPGDWYQLPENAQNLSLAKVSRSQTEAIFDQLLSANAAAIGKLSFPAMRASRSDDTVPWHLARIFTDLAVSAEGGIGILALKGTTAMSLHWAKAGTNRAEHERARTIFFSETEIPTDAAIQLEPFIRAVIATGKIRNTVKFRDQLAEAAARFLTYARALARTPKTNWLVSGLRLELAIGAEGDVAPGIAVGAQLGIRFEWLRATNPIPSMIGSAPSTPEDERLIRFVQDLCEDVESSFDGKFAQSPFAPDQFLIGIGVTAEGDFGVVKASGSLIGTLIFVPTNGSRRTIGKSGAQGFIPIIEGGTRSQAHHLAYARRSQIHFRQISESHGIIDNVFEIDRRRFRRGLERLVSMSLFFSEHAYKARARDWIIDELDASFELSISGGFSVVTVGGLVNAELDLVRRGT